PAMLDEDAIDCAETPRVERPGAPMAEEGDAGEDVSVISSRENRANASGARHKEKRSPERVGRAPEPPVGLLLVEEAAEGEKQVAGWHADKADAVDDFLPAGRDRAANSDDNGPAGLR